MTIRNYLGFELESGGVFMLTMGLVLLLIVLGLLFGGFGLIVAGLKWLLIIGIVMFVAGLATGAFKRKAKA